MNKRHIVGIVRIIAFILILLICIEVVNCIVKRKDYLKRKADFFSQKEDFDVLFFSSSHILNGIQPLKLWKENGIISYNMGVSGEQLNATYYNMQLAMKEKKPKLVIIDAFYVNSNDKYDSKKLGNIHSSFDVYPISYTKYLAIKDIFNGQNLLDNEVRFLLPFSIYHSRWSGLKEEDFDNKNEVEKGTLSLINITEEKEKGNYNTVEVYSGKETVNMTYLRKIIEYCKENNIEILITYLPYFAKDEHVAMSKYVEKICNEYDVEYINFLNIDITNYKIDYYDDGHLNVSGARKVTEYLGNYIQEHYDIPDQRQNIEYNFWNEDYNEYIDFKINCLNNQENKMNNYLMLLYDEKDIKYKIEISSKKKIQEGSVLKALLENLNNNYSVNDEPFEEEKYKDKTVKITTWDNRNNELIKEAWF